ncbi:hypothetical protein M3Y99_00695500 [Aphelenchoides fujianensis]|nr:hypothetical protein M3Y99_00695500 [Aphelenchoides fujianensis]
MSEAEQQPATVAPPSEQSADAAEATAESAPAENPPTDGPPADGVPAEGQKPAAPVSEEEAAVVTEVVAAAVIAVAADENSPKSAEQSEAIDSPPKAEEPPKEEEPPREEPPRQEERPEVVVPPEGNQQPAAPPNEQAGDVEPPQPPAHVVEERPQEAAEEVESIDEEPPLDRVPLPLVPRSHELEHAEEEYRRQQQAQFELKANRVEGERVPFQFAERRAEDLWEDDEPPQRAPVEAEQDEQGANAEAEVVAELPPTPPSLEAQDEAASTRSLAGSLAGSELRVDAALKPEDAPADPAANDEKPPAEEASKPESPKAEGDEPKDVADSKSKDEKPPEAQEPAKIEPPVPERQDSWDDGFPRDAKPAARPSQDLVDPWASDPEDSPPAARKISTVAAEDAWGDDVPAVTAAQWNAAPDPEPKKFEENRNFSSPSHNARGGGHFGGSSRGEPSGRGGLGARGRGSYDEQPARNNFQRSNGRGDGHRAEENFRSDRHSSAYDEPPKHQPAHNAGNNQRSYGGRGGRDGGGWDDNRTAQRPNDRPHFPQHANNFNDDNRQSTGGYAGGGRGEANGGYNSQNQRSFGGHLQANERFEDERQHQSAPYHQQDRQQQHQSYDQAPHKRQSEAKVNDWLHDQQSQNAHSQDARSQHRQQFEYRRSGNEQRGNASEWGNRSTGSGQRGGGAYERDEYRNSNVQGGRQPADDRHHQQQHQSYGSQQRGDDQWNTSNSYENSKPFGGNGDHARHEPRGHFRSNDYEQQPPNGDRNRGFGQSEGGFRDFGRGQDNNNREYPRDGNRDYQRENRGEFDRRSQFSGGANERGRNEYSRSGHEQPQEGEAPSFRHTLFGGYVAKDRPAHEPSFRSTDEIFEDDEQKKDRYAVIADEDGGVVVHNMPHNEEVQVMDTWKDAMLDETIVANTRRSR